MNNFNIIKSKLDVKANVNIVIQSLNNRLYDCERVSLYFQDSVKYFQEFKPTFGGNTTGRTPVYNYNRLDIHEINEDGEFLISWNYGRLNSFTSADRITKDELMSILWDARKGFNATIKSVQKRCA